MSPWEDRGPSQRRGQVGERQAASTQTPHRARGGIWKGGGKTDGDLAEQGGPLRSLSSGCLCMGRGMVTAPHWALQTDQWDGSALASGPCMGAGPPRGPNTRARAAQADGPRATVVGTAYPGSGESAGTTPTPRPPPRPRLVRPPAPDQPQELVLHPGVDPESKALRQLLHPPQVGRHVRQPQYQPGGRPTAPAGCTQTWAQPAPPPHSPCTQSTRAKGRGSGEGAPRSVGSTAAQVRPMGHLQGEWGVSDWWRQPGP